MELLDRNAYRMYSDFRLIDAAKYNPNAELAIVLAERLEEVQAENDESLEAARERAADFEREANKLDDEVCELQHKIDVLELMLTTRDDIIEQLKKGAE